jgi:hypothetical protein
MVTTQIPVRSLLLSTTFNTFNTMEKLVIVMESSLARLGSGSSRNFLLLLEKLEPKNQQSLIGLTEKKSGLKSLIF